MTARNEINRHRFAFFSIGMILSCSLVLWAFSWKSDPRESTWGPTEVIDDGIQIISTWMPDPEPEKQKQKETLKKEDPFQETSKLILKDLTIEPIKKTIIKPVSIASSSTPHKLPLISTGNDIVMPDVKASFPGGNKALKLFLRKHLRYPSDMLNEGESGRVVVSFIVDESGDIVHVKILKSDLGPSAIREAQRVISLMPNWIPGYYKGNKVRSNYIQAFNFILY